MAQYDASLSSLKVTGHVESRLNQLLSEYDAVTRPVTLFLCACSQLCMQQSTARLNCRWSFACFFVVLMIARHDVFGIFVNFLVYNAL